MTGRAGLPRGWPATAFELAVEAIARRIDLSVGDGGRLNVRGPRAEVDRLSNHLRDRREEIIALLKARSHEAERITAGPYEGFWAAKGRAGPDPLRGGLCMRRLGGEARVDTIAVH